MEFSYVNTPCTATRMLVALMYQAMLSPHGRPYPFGRVGGGTTWVGGEVARKLQKIILSVKYYHS